MHNIAAKIADAESEHQGMEVGVGKKVSHGGRENVKKSMTGLGEIVGEIKIALRNGKRIIVVKEGLIRAEILRGKNGLAQGGILLNALDPVIDSAEAPQDLADLVRRMPAIIHEIIKCAKCLQRGKVLQIVDDGRFFSAQNHRQFGFVHVIRCSEIFARNGAFFRIIQMEQIADGTSNGARRL